MWRNWQTHQTQNLAGNHVGSSPTIGTNEVFIRIYRIGKDKYHSEMDGIFFNKFISVYSGEKIFLCCVSKI